MAAIFRITYHSHIKTHSANDCVLVRKDSKGLISRTPASQAHFTLSPILVIHSRSLNTVVTVVVSGRERSEMASIRPSLSTRRGGNLQVGSDINDGISLLDVLYANEFEGEPDDAVADKEVEVNFYRGSQAKWRNFYLAEQPGPDGRVPVWIKRDGYDDLRKRILRCRTGRMTFTLKLLHQPGSGGTTLAMQLLWDLRTTLRCAILTFPTADKDAIAKIGRAHV